MDDESRRSPSVAVLRAVADEKDADVTDLEPLYNYVEPAALDDLCSHGFDGALTFHYLDYEVTIHGDGRIEIRS